MSNLPAVVDIEGLRQRYVPAEGEILSEDEFEQRGIELVQTARACFALLGELIDWKFRQERADTDHSRRQIVMRYAACWGVGQSTLWKAWVLVQSQILLPEDASPTLAYEIISGCSSTAEAERVLDLALGSGWSVNDAREVKALRSLGLISDWQRIRLVHNGDGVIMADDGERRVPVARLLGDSDLARAGAALLRMRGRV